VSGFVTPVHHESSVVFHSALRNVCGIGELTPVGTGTTTIVVKLRYPVHTSCPPGKRLIKVILQLLPEYSHVLLVVADMGRIKL